MTDALLVTNLRLQGFTI